MSAQQDRWRHTALNSTIRAFLRTGPSDRCEIEAHIARLKNGAAFNSDDISGSLSALRDGGWIRCSNAHAILPGIDRYGNALPPEIPLWEECF